MRIGLNKYRTLFLLAAVFWLLQADYEVALAGLCSEVISSGNEYRTVSGSNSNICNALRENITYQFDESNNKITVSQWPDYLYSADESDGCYNTTPNYSLDTTADQIFSAFLWVQKYESGVWTNYQANPSSGYMRWTSYSGEGPLASMMPAEMNYALYSTSETNSEGRYLYRGLDYCQDSSHCHQYNTQLSVAFDSLPSGDYRTQMVVYDRDVERCYASSPYYFPDDDDHLLLWTGNWYEFSVGPAVEPPTLNFWAGAGTDPSRPLQHRDATILQWTSTNATACTASGNWSGSKPVNSGLPWPTTGSLNGPASYYYALTCTGPGGSVTDSFTIYVAAPISGQCGTARYQNHIFGQTESFPGSYTYCATGTVSPNPPSNPSAGGSSTWTCAGPSGGPTVSCEARRQLNGQCGNAQGNYSAYDTAYRSTFCSAGSRINYVNRFPNIGETISSAWQCQGLNGGTTPTCSVNRDSLAAYDLWIYENDCTGSVGDTIDIVTSDTATINWNPDPNDVSIVDINGKTLCYEAHENCSVGDVRTIGREYRTYNCSVPDALLYDPASVEVKSRAEQPIDVSVQCSGGEVLPLNHDVTTSNNVDWNVNGRFSALQACNSPTSITYSGADQYMLSTGNSDRDCTQTLETRVANYIFGGYDWGEVTGLLPITILQEYFTVDYDCPECGTKYMDVNIEVPLVQCS